MFKFKSKVFIGCAAIFLAASSAQASGFYDIKMKNHMGKNLDFAKFRGKPVLIVNIASSCGFTPQLGDMAIVHEQYKERGLQVVAVPSNSFNQEALDSLKAGEFCETRYKSKYIVTEKVDVTGPKKSELYKFLVANAPTDKGKDVSWNFGKFLVDKNGNVVARLSPEVKPTANELTTLIEKYL